MKPNFLIVGAQKSGTSYFHKKLRQHPQVYLFKNEIAYFAEKKKYDKGGKWYNSHFPKQKGNYKIIGEKSAGYLWADSSKEERIQNIYDVINEDLGEIKILITLRDPVKRAVSAYNHHLRAGRIKPSEAFNGHIDKVLQNPDHELNRQHGILEMGNYQNNIPKFIHTFTSENVCIKLFEKDIIANPEKGLRDLCKFLNIEDYKFRKLRKKVNRREPSKFYIFFRYYFPFLKPALLVCDVFPSFKAKPNEQTIQFLKGYYSPTRDYVEKVTDVNLKKYWKW